MSEEKNSMNVEYRCTNCGHAGQLKLQPNPDTGVVTLPPCPNCDKELMFGLDVTGAMTYETSFGEMAQGDE